MLKLLNTYLIVNVKRGVEHQVSQKIRDIHEVIEVLVTYGLWDLMVGIKTETLKYLDKFITDNRQIEEIEHSRTIVSS